MIELVYQNSTADKGFKKDFFEKISNTIVKELNLKEKSLNISFNIVGENRIKELNRKYRHKNKVTDVLSFPMSDKPLRKLHATSYTPQASDFGDIFICLPFAKNQTKSENISIERKLAQLTVHGFLHLAGYDHEKSTGEAKKMFDLENRILKKLSVF